MALLVFGLAAESHGQDGEKSVTVGWETLALEERAFDDPFARLSPKQLQDVSYALRVGRLISEKKLSPEGSDATRATKIAGDLKQQGFDLAWLMAQRRAVRKLRTQQVEVHAASVTKKFQGQQVTLYGFAVPISAKAKSDTEFFLVPSHLRQTNCKRWTSSSCLLKMARRAYLATYPAPDLWIPVMQKWPMYKLS